MTSFLEMGPPRLTADARKYEAPSAKSKIYRDIIKIRKAIGGLKAVKAKPKEGEKTVPFAVKSAAVLMHKFRRALDRFNMLCYPVHTEFSLVPKEKGAIAYATYTFRLVSDDGSYLDVVCTSEGADAQDKAAGKCMTYGWKFALIYTLCLPDADIKEDWGEDELADSDSDFEPTNEPGGISATSTASYIKRISEAPDLDTYNSIVADAKVSLSIKELQKLSKAALPYKERLIEAQKVASIAAGPDEGMETKDA